MGRRQAAGRGAVRVGGVVLVGVVVLAGAAVVGLRLRPWQASPRAVEARPVAVNETIVLVGSFVINLDPRNGYRYLKCTVAVRVRGAASPENLQQGAAARRYQWSDVIVRYLSGRKYSDLYTSAGRDHLSRDLARLLTEAGGGLVVDAVYFSEFVAQ